MLAQFLFQLAIPPPHPHNRIMCPSNSTKCPPHYCAAFTFCYKLVVFNISSFRISCKSTCNRTAPGLDAMLDIALGFSLSDVTYRLATHDNSINYMYKQHSSYGGNLF